MVSAFELDFHGDPDSDPRFTIVSLTEPVLIAAAREAARAPAKPRRSERKSIAGQRTRKSSDPAVSDLTVATLPIDGGCFVKLVQCSCVSGLA
jgi:hypothetical protein